MKYALISEPKHNLTTIEQILVNRGIEISKINNYIRTTDDVLYSPLLLNNIENGIDILLSHLEKKSKILLQLDSDCDGYTSGALLLNYLYAVNSEWLNNIDFRVHSGKEHGLDFALIESLTSDDYQLILVPDASSNEYEIHALLKSKKIDCLIIDHHEAPAQSENAIVINPQLDDYPNKNLSAVGVVYKFCKLLDSKLGVDLADNFLDLVALGMVADMMDIRELETKHLISKGIINIRNPFIKSLIERQSNSLKDGLSPNSFGFYIAPLINATIRIGTEEEKLTMFKGFLDKYANEEMDSTKRGAKPGETETFADRAARQSMNIKNRQAKMRDEGIALIEEIIQRESLNDNKVLVVVLDQDIDKNLSGLIANKIMSKYKKPVLILRNNNETLNGSARGYEKSELRDFKLFLNDSGLVNYAEGHANAFGAGIDKDKLENFIEYSNEQLKDFDFSATHLVDFIWDSETLTSQDIFDVANLRSFWGKGVEEALICIKGLKVTKDRIALLSPDKSPTIKINFKGIDFIKFGSSQQEFESLRADTGYIEIDIVGKCSINEWNGNITAQVFIEDYAIKDTKAWYF